MVVKMNIIQNIYVYEITTSYLAAFGGTGIAYCPLGKMYLQNRKVTSSH